MDGKSLAFAGALSAIALAEVGGAELHLSGSQPAFRRRQGPFVPRTYYPAGFKADLKQPEKGRSVAAFHGLPKTVGAGPKRFRNGLTGKETRKAKKQAMKTRKALEARGEA